MLQTPTTGFLIFGLIGLALATLAGQLIYINCQRMLALFNVRNQKRRNRLSVIITIICLLLLANEFTKGSAALILGMIAGVAVSVRQLSTSRNSDGSVRLYSTAKLICWLVLGAILGALSAWSFILLTASIFWR